MKLFLQTLPVVLMCIAYFTWVFSPHYPFSESLLYGIGLTVTGFVVFGGVTYALIKWLEFIENKFK